MNAPAKHLTVRRVPPELARALEEEKRRRGDSLNQTVIELLQQSLGVGPELTRSNGLADLAGSWSDEDHDEFEEAVALFEEIDEGLWR